MNISVQLYSILVESEKLQRESRWVDSQASRQIRSGIGSSEACCELFVKLLKKSHQLKDSSRMPPTQQGSLQFKEILWDLFFQHKKKTEKLSAKYVTESILTLIPAPWEQLLARKVFVEYPIFSCWGTHSNINCEMIRSWNFRKLRGMQATFTIVWNLIPFERGCLAVTSKSLICSIKMKLMNHQRNEQSDGNNWYQRRLVATFSQKFITGTRATPIKDKLLLLFSHVRNKGELVKSF